VGLTKEGEEAAEAIASRRPNRPEPTVCLANFFRLHDHLICVEDEDMGTTREIGTEQDEKHEAAVQIALEVGLLEKCETHGCIYDAMNDFALDDAIRCGEELITQNDPAVATFQGNRKRLRHAIEDVRSGMPNSCPDCYHARFKD
jgi:hypothetical protein